MAAAAGGTADKVKAMDQRTVQIFYKSLEGTTRVLAVDLFETVEATKHRIEKLEGIAADELSLTFGGKPLNNGRTLAECHKRGWW